MIRATLRATIEAPWTTLSPVRVGPVPPGVRTPAVMVTVEDGDAPVLRIDVYEGEPAHHAFEEALVWHGLVVIGFGNHVHFVSLATRTAASYPLNGYFGHLYPSGDRVLVADAERLHCFAPTGSRLWTSGMVGIDGVLVDGISDGVVEGSGEWDPPGGWRPFKVVLATGEPLTPTPL